MMTTVEEREARLVENLRLLDDWMSQYEYLLSFYGKAAELPRERRVAESKLAGCASDAWVELSAADDGSIAMAAASESLIVGALLGMVASLIEGAPAEEVARWEPAFPEAPALREHFGSERKDGVRALLKRVRDFAEESAGRPFEPA